MWNRSGCSYANTYNIIISIIYNFINCKFDNCRETATRNNTNDHNNIRPNNGINNDNNTNNAEYNKTATNALLQPDMPTRNMSKRRTMLRYTQSIRHVSMSTRLQRPILRKPALQSRARVSRCGTGIHNSSYSVANRNNHAGTLLVLSATYRGHLHERRHLYIFTKD